MTSKHARQIQIGIVFSFRLKNHVRNCETRRRARMRMLTSVRAITSPVLDLLLLRVWLQRMEWAAQLGKRVLICRVETTATRH